MCIRDRYSEDNIKDHFREKTPEENKKLIWEEIKNIKKELPTYKHIKEISITTDPLEKTTTQKVKRYVEMKKMETAK